MSKKNPTERKFYFVNRYFYPDHSATSQILSDLAFYLSSKGFNIEIITSRQKYDDSEAALSKNDVINGVKVNRLATTRFGRVNLLGRSIDYLSFYVSAFFYMMFNVRSNDVVVAKTDPPLISVVSAVICKLKGAVQVNWIQDLFPEVAESLQVKGISFLYPMLKAARNSSLKMASKNIVIGDLMSSRLLEQGVKEDKIDIIHNWSIEDNIEPLDASKNPLREKWNLKDKFIVGYSGNIGRAHEYQTMIDAAKMLLDNDNIVFLIIGGGAQYKAFKEQAIELQLHNVHFQPYQPIDVLPYSLTLPDLHIISLIPELEGLIVPSKFYGIAASGRPVLYIGSNSGEIPKILESNNCGQTVDIGDSKSAINFINKLNDNYQLSTNMGMSSRKVYDEKYAKLFAFNSWVRVLNSL